MSKSHYQVDRSAMGEVARRLLDVAGDSEQVATSHDGFYVDDDLWERAFEPEPTPEQTPEPEPAPASEPEPAPEPATELAPQPVDEPVDESVDEPKPAAKTRKRGNA